MRKQEQYKLKALSNVADLVGDFILYWGFRKIHGKIWTILYLSKKPISGAELVNILGVSKALVSPALKELEYEGLIIKAESENLKTKRYVAEEEVFKVIRNVLDRRERPLIEKIISAQHQLGQEVSHSDSACSKIVSTDRYQNLKKMTEVALLSLSMIADTELSVESFVSTTIEHKKI